MQNSLRTLTYVSLSLFLSFVFFSPKANAASSAYNACMAACQKERVSAEDVSKGKHLMNLKKYCKSECNKDSKKYDSTLM